MSDYLPLQLPYVNLRFHAPKNADAKSIESAVESYVLESANVVFEDMIYVSVGTPVDVTEWPFSVDDGDAWCVGMDGTEDPVYYLKGFVSGAPFSLAGKEAGVLDNRVACALYNFQFTFQIRVYCANELASSVDKYPRFIEWIEGMIRHVSPIASLAGLSGSAQCDMPSTIKRHVSANVSKCRFFEGTELQETQLHYNNDGDGIGISHHLEHCYQRPVDMLAHDEGEWVVTTVAYDAERRHSLSLNLCYYLDPSALAGPVVFKAGDESLPIWYLDVQCNSNHLTLSQLVGVPVIKDIEQWAMAIKQFQSAGLFQTDIETVWLDFLLMSTLPYAEHWLEKDLSFSREPKKQGGDQELKVMLQNEVVFIGVVDDVAAYLGALLLSPPSEGPIDAAKSLASHFSSMPESLNIIH